MFQHLKRWFRPAGIVFDQATVQVVRVRPGRSGQPVVSCRVYSLSQFAGVRLVGPFRRFVGALPAQQARLGCLMLPVGLAPSVLKAEVGHLIRQTSGDAEPLVFDFVSQDTEQGWAIEYVAARESDVSVLHAAAARMGVILSEVDLDVFAMRRAAWALKPQVCRDEAEAVLWVGETAGLFAVFQGAQVRHVSAWSLKTAGAHGLPPWVSACALQVQQAGLSDWAVCAATAMGVSAVVTASSELGLAPTLLDLSRFGVDHPRLANAFIALGLALRGWVDD